MFKIEKNVPIPGANGRRKYPLHKMEVGDSFQFPEGDSAKVSAAAGVYGRRNGMKFSVSSSERRCWRIE